MTQEYPLVTVVVPAYNHEKLVRRAIRSVLENGYPAVELIVIDDGSTDATWRAIQQERDVSGQAFQAFTQSNAGICRTLNRGVRLGSGSLIALLASDDYFLPGKLRAQVDRFRGKSKFLGVVHTSAYIDYLNDMPLVDMTGSYPPALGSCFDAVLDQSMRVIAPSIMFRRTAYDDLGGFDESLATEDVDFFVRLAAKNYTFDYIAEPLMVRSASHGSAGKQLEVLLEVHRSILEKHQSRFSQNRRDELERLLLRQFIGMNSAAGNYRRAFTLTRELFGRTHAFSEWMVFAERMTRSALLRAMPQGARHALRMVRARARQSLKA